MELSARCGFSIRLFNIAGTVSAFSMWINDESMVPVGITIGILGLLWLWQDRNYAEKSLHFILALFIFTGISLLLERAWYNLLAQEYDRLSIVHLSMFGFITALWIAIFMINRHTHLISLGLSIYLLFWSPRTEQLKGWIYIFLMVIAFTCLALMMYRWAYYAQAIVVIPMAEVMNRTLAGCKNLKNKLLMIGRNVLIKMAFILGLLFLGITVDIIFSKNTGSYKRISLIPFCEYLNEADI